MRGQCECTDPGCPQHMGKSCCQERAVSTLFRTDMLDETGTRLCQECANDCLDQGMFTDEPPRDQAADALP